MKSKTLHLRPIATALVAPWPAWGVTRRKIQAALLRRILDKIKVIPVENWAAGPTDRGDFALIFAGCDLADGTERQCEHVCSKADATNIAGMIIRAVAQADQIATAGQRA